MANFDENLDAYRVLAQILKDLRSGLFEELRKRHGEDWHRKGLPPQVLDRLVKRKEREQTIDWYESEYQQIFDFASFEDLLEVLESDPELFPLLRTLAPSPPLLHARLMEMEVMREKLALARSISENELVFLSTFHQRFQKLMEARTREGGAARPARPAEAGEAVAPAAGATAGPAVAVADEPAPRGPAPANEETPARPGKPRKKKAKESDVSATPAPAPGRQAIEKALDDGDDRLVLRALYREVTAIAEGLWKSDVPPTPTVWEKVRQHDWYERSFSSLGLKPLSDFYDIIDEVLAKMRAGTPQDELQGFLKEHNFAKVLLALRDMFQRNQV